MINGFKDQDTEKIFNTERAKKLPQEIQKQARNKLLMIDAAKVVDDLRNPPGNRLEALHGDREGQFSIRINVQWRVCFTWSESGANDVEIVDYH